MEGKNGAFALSRAPGGKSPALKTISGGNILMYESERMMRIRTSVLAAATVAGALALAGCVQTHEIDQTMPPYASISDEGRDPPKPPPPNDSAAFMHALRTAL